MSIVECVSYALVCSAEVLCWKPVGTVYISQGGKEDSIKDEVMIHAIRMLKDCRSDAVECSLMWK